jgi:hypothetical protein
MTGAREYAGTHTDARGTEHIVIANDGCTLSVEIRGIRFSGGDFDGLSPESARMEEARELFTLCRGCLCECQLAFAIPVLVFVDGERLEVPLEVALSLGEPLSNGSLAHEIVKLALRLPLRTVASSGRSGWFEDELLEIARALDDNERLLACITCQFSDYHPVGHGLFGGLACFRDTKDEYLAVTDKQGLFALWDRQTELVQETHVCADHLVRRPGTGYRG